MKYYAVLFTFFLFFAGVARAHGVSVFAFVDGDEIKVECGSGNSRLEITDSETGENITQGTTDDHGLFRFHPGAAFLATGHGLNIRLLAGEGHQDDWTIGPEELRGLSRPAPASGGNQALPLPAVDMAGLEAMIGRVVEAEIAPLKETLERQLRDAAKPRLRDIVGGLGWIAGLLGLIAYRRYKHARK